ncbi:MAG: hypothetical protein WCO65_00440 [bacterium]
MKKNTNFTTITVASYKNIVEAKNIFEEFRLAKIANERWRNFKGCASSIIILVIYLLLMHFADVVNQITNLRSALGLFGLLLQIAIISLAVIIFVAPFYVGVINDVVFEKKYNDKDVILALNRCKKMSDVVSLFAFLFEFGSYHLDFIGKVGSLTFQFYFDGQKDNFCDLTLDSEGQIRIIDVTKVSNTDTKEEVTFDLWQIFLSELEEKTGYKHFELTDGNKIRAWSYNPADNEVKEEHFLIYV